MWSVSSLGGISASSLTAGLMPPSRGASALTSRWSSAGGPGAVDRERRPHSGQQRPHVHAAEDPQRPDPDLLHPADLPLHVGEQADGGHRQGALASVPELGACSGHCEGTAAVSLGSLQGFMLVTVFCNNKIQTDNLC